MARVRTREPAGAWCAKCGLPIEEIGGAWVVMNTGTTADGLSFCPPDPDTTAKVGSHRPVERR